jgi:hypothetical protein
MEPKPKFIGSATLAPENRHRSKIIYMGMVYFPSAAYSIGKSIES